MTLFGFYGTSNNQESMITLQELNYFFETNAEALCVDPRPPGYHPNQPLDVDDHHE
jgi:hypothetical protein